jgi:hypothetical protein
MRRAVELIEDLGADLDRRLPAETRASERLRLLRETTNRITRAANDAIQAYGRGRRTVTSELAREGHRGEVALRTQMELQTARADLLRAIEKARQRYPWADADEGGSSSSPASQP